MQSYRDYSFAFQTMLFYPIRVALFERSISVPTLVNQLNLKGIKIAYSANGINACIMGTNTNSISLHYISNIYEVLDLPLPTPQYLYDSFKRWEEIKAFKLERRNTNRIKKGLQPVTSISTRIK